MNSCYILSGIEAYITYVFLNYYHGYEIADIPEKSYGSENTEW